MLVCRCVPFEATKVNFTLALSFIFLAHSVRLIFMVLRLLSEHELYYPVQKKSSRAAMEICLLEYMDYFPMEIKK